MSTLSPFDTPHAPSLTVFEWHDPEFDVVLGDMPRLEHVVAADAHEGPVYAPDEDALYFTSVPRAGVGAGSPVVTVERVELDGERFPIEPDRVTTVAPDANVANGMTLDLEGNLLICEQGSMTRDAAITRLDRSALGHDIVVDRWRGLRFNSPNDLVGRRDGTIWFTDPSYGFLQGFRPEPEAGDHVYRYDPVADRVSVVADSLDKPNGLAFSPDESILYVTDSGANQEVGSFHVDRPHHIVAFDVLDGRHLSAGRLFAVTTPGVPDGIKVDDAGHVYASAAGGVQVFDPTGDLIGEIHVPDAVNFAFGGQERNVLFITSDTDIWAAVLASQGGPWKRVAERRRTDSQGKGSDRDARTSHT